jgi:hypothetical protein
VIRIAENSSILQEFFQNRPHPLRISQVTFPYDFAFPSQLAQKTSGLLISCSISLYLLHPVFAIVDRDPIAALATMPMPEAPMDENHFLSAAEDEIRGARQIFSMKSIAVTLCM